MGVTYRTYDLNGLTVDQVSDLGPLSLGDATLTVGAGFEGQIAEVLVYSGSTQLRDYESWMIRDYLRSRYGGSLGAQPPYLKGTNLVANPSGELDYADTWTAHGGMVRLRQRGARFGAHHVEYVVTERPDDGEYWVSPLTWSHAPQLGAYTIDATSRQAGFSIYITSPMSAWVSASVEWLTLDPRSGAFTSLSVEDFGSRLYVKPYQHWQRLVAARRAPDAATHYQVRLNVYPDESGTRPPQLGTTIWLDAALVPDDGYVVGAPFFDGDHGAQWRGTRGRSPSSIGVTFTPEPDLDIEAPTPPFPAADFPIHHPAGDTDTGERPAWSVYYWRPPSPTDAAMHMPAGKLCLSADVLIGESLVLNDVDDDGTIWLLEDIDGWWTLPETDVPDTDRGTDDGSYVAAGRYKARVFTVRGTFIPRDPTRVSAIRNKLITQTTFVRAGGFFGVRHRDPVTGEYYVRYSKVFTSGPPQISTLNRSGRTEFAVGFRAPDPIQYGSPIWTDGGFTATIDASTTYVMPRRSYGLGYLLTPGQDIPGVSPLVLNNIGNIETAPRLEITGPSDHVLHVVNATTGQDVTLIQPLDATDTLHVNTFNRQVGALTSTGDSLNGFRFVLDTFTDWLRLAPGENRLYLLDEGNTVSPRPRLTVSWNPGWIA